MDSRSCVPYPRRGQHVLPAKHYRHHTWLAWASRCAKYDLVFHRWRWIENRGKIEHRADTRRRHVESVETHHWDMDLVVAEAM